MHQKPQQNKIKAIIPDQEARQKAMLARLPKPIITIHKQGNKFLGELLENCFNEIDDTLFDLAKNTVKQQDQDDYFFAMREIRAQKETIAQAFIQAIKNKYCSLTVPVDNQSYIVTTIGDVSFDELAVIGNEDMNEIVALEAMASRSAKVNEPLIKLLANRIKAVVPADPSAKDLPVSPSILCEAFAKSVKTIRIDSKSTLVLFKLFEKTVVNQLGKLYQLLNTLLAERGILPENTTHSPLNTHVHTPTEHDGTGGLHMPVETFIDPSPLSSSDTTHAPATPSAHTNIGSILKSISQQQLSEARQGGQYSFLKNLLKTAANDGGHSRDSSIKVSTKERNLVTILDRLFSAVDDQDQMPDQVKHLFQQLQLPLAKVALSDHTFFTNPKHSARQLLNTLSSNAVRFDSLLPEALKTDPLFEHLKTTVKNLTTADDPSSSDFSEQVTRLREFKEQEARREALFEQQLIRAEQGRITSGEMESLVNSTISEVCQGMEIQHAVNDIIQNAWKRVLIHTATKYGEESEQWDNHLETLIELVTSTQTYANQMDLVQGQASLKDLKITITENLLTIGHDAFKTAKMIEQLETTFESLSNTLESKESATHKAPRNEQLENLARQVESDIVISPETEQKSVDAVHVSVSDAFIKQAKNLNRGTWFDLVTGGVKTRCRLAAIIAPHQLYIFVNNSGGKVSSNNLEEVASMLQNQELVYLDSSHIFDAALEKIISGIKKDPEKTG